MLERPISLAPIVFLAAFGLAADGVRLDGRSGAPEATLPPAAAPLLDNLGTYHRPITTRSDQAQKYFDQGLRLTYAFNNDEAERSFREAARFDPDCAMAWWGVALALGPNINMPIDTDRNKAAYRALQKGLAVSSPASEQEAAYLRALSKRYSPDSGVDRAALDRAYADAVREVHRRFPDDLDASTLFAESLMDLRPWKLWSLDGRPRERTRSWPSSSQS